MSVCIVTIHVSICKINLEPCEHRVAYSWYVSMKYVWSKSHIEASPAAQVAEEDGQAIARSREDEDQGEVGQGRAIVHENSAQALFQFPSWEYVSSFPSLWCYSHRRHYYLYYRRKI